MPLYLDFILVAGIVISSIILFLLLKASDKKAPKKVLLVYFAYILAVILHSYSNLHKLESLYKLTFIFDFTIIWLFGPLLYIYIKSIFLDENKLIQKNSLHFIPLLLISIVVGFPIVFTLYKTDSSLEYLRFLEENQVYIVIVRNIYFIVYLILSLNLFTKYKRTIEHSFSNISEADLNWIRILLYGCFLFATIDLATRWFEEFFASNISNYGYLTIFLIIVLTTYLGFKGISRSKILIPNFLLEKQPETFQNVNTTNSLSGHTKQEISKLKEKLALLMNESKLYLDPELTLNILAKEVGISDKKLSTLLNMHFHANFYDYVNTFRIEEVKKKLQNKENEKFTLLSIALDCGFNSKASFNRVFKKLIGLSPSQYISSKVSHKKT